MNTLTDITRKALSLSIEERVILIQRLRESMEHFESEDIEKLWMEEADRRWKEIEKGNISCRPAREVMKLARESLKD